MKRIFLLPFTVLIVIFGCRKHENSNQSGLDLKYAAKYTPLMGGSRLWHRYYTYFPSPGSPGYGSMYPTRVDQTDTNAAISIVNDTTIIIPLVSDTILFNGYINLYSDTGNMLYFYADYIPYGSHIESVWEAYYFPANDSISLVHGGSEVSWENDYFHSP